jgi:hypothetical protein
MNFSSGVSQSPRGDESIEIVQYALIDLQSAWGTQAFYVMILRAMALTNLAVLSRNVNHTVYGYSHTPYSEYMAFGHTIS